MMSQSVLAQLSVQEFFQGYNWSGQPPKLASLSQSTTIDPASWLNLSLGEFLSQSNWKNSVRVQLQPEKILSLTLSVQEYFQFSVWEGKPSVAVVSKSPTLSDPKAAQKFQVTDLSNLF